jgi:predicted MarR family transcription regulator
MNTKHAAGEIDEQKLSELELALTVLWNSVRRWISQRTKESVIAGLSDLDIFLLHLLVYRGRRLRGIDLAFALSIDDMHLVSYSLKKLVRLDAITSTRVGKEVFYTAAKKGKQHYAEFLDDRRKFLQPAMRYMSYGELSPGALTELLRALAGIYEQAARSASTAKG